MTGETLTKTKSSVIQVNALLKLEPKVRGNEGVELGRGNFRAPGIG